MKLLSDILSFFLREPGHIHFAPDLLDKLDCSQASLYRILEVLEQYNLILKYRQAYTLNSRIISDTHFYRNELPYLGKLSKGIAYLYLIRYLLFNLEGQHTIPELKILFRRPRKDIAFYLDLLDERKIVIQKSDIFFQLNPDLIPHLARSSIVSLHKNIWSPR